MTVRNHLLVLACALGLGACSSTPTHYYTLIAPATQTQATHAQVPFQFEMQPVLMAVQVDQPPLVVRQGDGSLAILENDRWGAPLGDEFHDALTGELERRFGVRDLAGLPKQNELPVLSIRTDVRRFESIIGQYAMIDVVWNLSIRSNQNNGQRQTLTCSSVVRQPAGPGIENLVLAHQKALSSLADIIAKTATDWGRQPGTRCPS
ncbi:membrane integrity-associated transporter subunit PqiC [Pseudomonas sp. NPDC090203]|uniref:PqiC family protein n=1 Tax=Pseudomonas sp. NPDC090203 TaxID=3364477 RepID=UPI00381D186B